MSRFYPLRVVEVRRETRESVVLSLAVPASHREAFRFTQGQYLTLRATIGGTEVRRSYSICAAVQDEHLRVGIKQVPGGLFSTWANQTLRPGATLEALPPLGNFYVPLEAASRRHYLGVAAGSGITPLFGILKTTLLGEPHSSFTLVYGNRASSSIMFREELEDLKNRFLGRFNLIHVLSREQQDIELFNGRIDRAKCAALFRYWVDPATIDSAFICGPQAMMVEVSAALQAHGLAKSRIKFELFASQSLPGPRRLQTTPATGQDSHRCRATIILDGRARQLELDKNATSLLDAALEEGLELPYACKGGVCSTCRALLVEGEVDMDANFALEDYEIARGYILACQSYPVTDRIVVDFDR